MTLISWLIFALVLIICEVLTSSVFFFVCICIAIGSIFAGFTAYYFASMLWLQISVFILVSILSLYTVRPIFKRMISKTKTTKSNVDALIEAEAVVTEEITSTKAGFVKVFGEVWRAKSDIDIKIGEIVKVKSIEGTSLIVKKI
ncbi:MAG: NfeD family protein [Endomicrobium sp.]|jgi:membrane protein implicated in regulation of membrane protease activity|nr:NfeD family protein [Endomicrobium sp.]